jgi:hypothetical protein
MVANRHALSALVAAIASLAKLFATGVKKWWCICQNFLK